MPRPKTSMPKLTLHHNGSTGIVTLSDSKTGERRTFTCGRYGTAECQAEYLRILGEWTVRGRRLPPREEARPPADTISNNEVMLAFLDRHADRLSSSEKNHTLRVVREVRAFYGKEAAALMSPKRFKTIRENLIRQGLARRYVNDLCMRIRKIYRWAVEEELIPPSVAHGLDAVANLRPGQGGEETEPIGPPPEGALERVLPFVQSPIIKAILEVMGLCGARHGELRKMKLGEIDFGNPNAWKFTPAKHKGSRFGKKRSIFFGPRCQAVLKPFIEVAAGPDAVVFDVGVWDEIRRASLTRATKEPPSQARRRQASKAKKRKRPPGHVLGGAALDKGLERAIERANEHAAANGLPPVEKFHPHQLRHGVATELRKKFGLEASAIVLGHSSAAITDGIYAQRDSAVAEKIAAEVG